MERPRLGIFLSGGGTTAEAIIKATLTGEVPMKVACVVASTKKAGGIEKALQLGIPQKDIVILPPGKYRGADGKVNEERYGLKILESLSERGVDVVTQNGWMVHTPENVVLAYEGRMFNQHPGPVPEFGGAGMYGMRVHEARRRFIRAVGGRDSWTEAVAQWVHPFYDQGGVVRSMRVKVFPNDTAEDIQKRVLPEEHRNQIDMLKDFAAGRLHEVKRDSLILPGEEAILERVKREAIQLYPHG